MNLNIKQEQSAHKSLQIHNSKRLLHPDVYEDNKSQIEELNCFELEILNAFLFAGISFYDSYKMTKECFEESISSRFTPKEIASHKLQPIIHKEFVSNSRKPISEMQNIMNNLNPDFSDVLGGKIGKSQRPMTTVLNIKDSLSKNKAFEEIKFAEYKKESEKKILELNNKIFKISVISIFTIILLLTALMLCYTSAYNEGYKNGAKDTQKLYESIINTNNE